MVSRGMVMVPPLDLVVMVVMVVMVVLFSEILLFTVNFIQQANQIRHK